MASQTQKMKILYLMDILLKRTDEKHILSANELCDILESEYNMSAERKSIYNDIKALSEFGLDIVQLNGKTSGYYVASRRFELAELKLLVDAMQASRSITAKKTDELIRKLESLASRSDAGQLQQQVFLHNRPKTENETIYYNINDIHTAIYTNVKIRFQYTEWTRDKKVRIRRDGAYYVVSPWAMTWDDENYYMIACEEEGDELRHFRVDKMQRIEMIDESREGRELFDDFDIVAFGKRTFGMFGGRVEFITLSCAGGLAGVIIDRFGRDVMMVPEGEDRFHVNVSVAVSQQFFGWLAGLGSSVMITKPANVREEFLEYLDGIRKAYE